MKIILIGGPLSGKTTLLNKLSNNGFDVFEVNNFIDSLYNVGQPGYERIKEIFGDEFINENGVDKVRLAEKAMKERNIVEKLNSLIMPLIEEELSKPGTRVIEASGMKIPLVDATILVKADREELVKRFSTNLPNLQEDFVSQLIDKWDNNVKSDIVIDTTNGISQEDINLIKEKYL